MARSWSVVVLLLLAVLQVRADNVPSFREGKTYWYKYAMRAGTGLAEGPGRQFAGIGSKAMLRIQRAGDKLQFQFSDAYYSQFNEKLGDILKEIPLQYEKIEGNENLPWAQTLLNSSYSPFYAQFVHGSIERISYTDSEVESIVNFKRALVSLFQTNFQVPQHADPDHYHVMEGGIGGTCDTMYEFASLPPEDHPESQVINITKHRHYDKCTYRPHMFHSDMQGSKCAKCDEEHSHALGTISRVDYQLKGDRNKFTIERIDNTGFISFTPFTTNGQTILSVVNQSLTLDSIEDATGKRTEFIQDEFLVHDEQLSYRFNSDTHGDFSNVDLKESHYAHDILRPDKNLPEPHDNPDFAVEQVTSITGAAWKDLSSSAESLAKLVLFLQTLNYNELEHVWDEFVGKWDKDAEELDAEHAHSRKMLIKVFGLVGTNPSILFILNAIEAGKVKDLKHAVSMLEGIALYAKQPTGTLFERIRDFAKSESAKQLRILFTNAWLNAGSILYRGCIQDPFNPHPMRVHVQHLTYIESTDCDKYVEEIKSYFNDLPKDLPSHHADELLLIRVLNNAGTDNAFDHLLHVATDTGIHVSRFLRQTAMWSLTQFDESKHHKVVAAISPIFHNTSEDYVLRIYAFDVLFAVDDDMEFYADLIPFLAKETDMQLTAQIYSTLVSVVNSTDPCLATASKHARHILPYINPVQLNAFTHSQTKTFSLFNDKYNFGRSTTLSWIGSDVSIVPEELYMRQSINLLGYNFDFLEFGFRQHGFDDRQVQYGFQSRRGGISEAFENLYRESFGIPDEPPPSKHPLDLELYASAFGFDIHSLSINDMAEIFQHESHRIQNTEAGYSKIPIKFDEIFAFVNIRYAIPNDAGFPVKLELFMPGVYAVNGNVNLKTPRVEINADVRSNVFLDGSFGFIGANGQEFGYAIQTAGETHYKIDVAVTPNVQANELVIEYTPSTKPYNVGHFKSTPFTYAETRKNRLNVHHAKEIQRNHKFGHDYLGIGMNFQFNYEYEWNDYGSYRSFLKSFFKKSTSYEDYHYWIDRYYAGTRGFLDYAFFNPTARPFEYQAKFEPSTEHPTTKFITTIQCGGEPLKTAIQPDDSKFEFSSLNIKTVGKGQVDRSWEIHFDVGLKLPDLQSGRRKRVVFKRSGHPAWDEKDFKVCFTSDTEFHGYPDIWRGDNKDYNARVDYSAKLQISDKCESEENSDRQVTIQAHVEKSDEQLALGITKLPFYQACEEDKKHGQVYSFACHQQIQHISRLDKFTIDIHHTNTPQSVRKCFRRFFSFVRHYLYDNLEIEHFDVENPVDHINIVANLSFHHPIVDVQVKRPHENAYYRNVYVPSVIPSFQPYSLTDNWEQGYWRKIFNVQRPFCIVYESTVNTFDEVNYNYPKSKCYQLVIADCKIWDFAVLIRDLGSQYQHPKSLKIYLRDHEIEVQSLAKIGEEDNHISVLLDGKPIAEDGSRFTLEKTLVAFKFIDGYVLELPFINTRFFFDGKELLIESTMYHLGKVCGLCGTYNGEKKGEFTDHLGCKLDGPESFANRYTHFDDHCKKPDITHMCEK